MNCYCDSVVKRLIKSLHNQYGNSSPDKGTINFIIQSIKNDPEKIWNSTEPHLNYTKKGGSQSNISRFMRKITDQMQDDIYCFKSPGFLSIAMPKSKASATFKLVQVNAAEEDIDAVKLADKVSSEMKQLRRNFKIMLYDNHILIVNFIQICQHNYWCCNTKCFYASSFTGTVSSEKAAH